MTIHNNVIFNAALAGASGGVQNSRWMTNSDVSSYTAIQAQIVAFATAVDAAIATDVTLTQQDGNIILSVCHAVCADKFLQNQTPSNLSIMALAVAAYFTKVKSGTLPIAGGAVITPLSNVLFVDAGSTSTGTPDGSINNPFLNVQDAVDALPAGGGTIEIAPGVYADNITITGKTVTLVGLGGPASVTFAEMILTSDSTLMIDNIFGTESTLNGQIVIATNFSMTTVNCSDQFFAFCPTMNAVTGSFTTGSFNGSFDDVTVNSTCGLDGCSVNTLVCQTLQATNTSIQTSCEVSADSGFQACKMPNTLTMNLAAIATLDLASYQSYIFNGTVASGTVRVLGGLPQDLFNVVIPGGGFAAGDLNYVDVSTVGSLLAGIKVGDVVEGNPTADLHAAGAGGGFYAGCRVSANDTIRCAFFGAITAGAKQFHFSRSGALQA